eukprot:gnl/TRDRNA2_/TRDRNA2_194443_c0_seq1.p1 gnl/TRDRNA2_/TRDRNA2_194443_c0~~gnl/TRDRNA2_/TRDRNA2_194443_c0_seq1.p1  ORF type:complete len:426 (+),score=73.71 gnl/TRDRNA2_/TRDRNA2_194443_c0_seq1:106-1383(+)
MSGAGSGESPAYAPQSMNIIQPREAEAPYQAMQTRSRKSSKDRTKDDSCTYVPTEPQTLRERLSEFLDNPESSRAAAITYSTMMFLILASTTCVIVETVPEVKGNPVFAWVEVATTAAFTLEFILRFFASESIEAFALNGYTIIDFLAILPGYLEVSLQVFGWDSTANENSMNSLQTLRMLRFLRLFRVLRLAKVARHSQLLNVWLSVLGKVRAGVAVCVLLMLFLMVVSASLLYLVESDRCEEVGVGCEGFDSIPSAFWFAISTLSTVGYGDVIPSTPFGKVVAGMTSIVAVLCLSLAVAMISFDFAEQYREAKWKFDNRKEVNQDAQLQELQKLMHTFQTTCGVLVSRLLVASSKLQEDQETIMLKPMLKSLEDRAAMICSELHSFVYSNALDLELRGLEPHTGVDDGIELTAAPGGMPSHEN